MDPLSSIERELFVHSGAWTTQSRPHLATTLDGLGLLFDAMGTPEGAYGSDYGPTTAEGSLTDFDTLPDWQAGTKRLLLRASTSPNDGDNYTLSGYITADGFVDISSTAFTGDISLSDFVVRNASTILNGVQQSAAYAGLLTLQNGLIEGQTNRCINVQRAEISKVRFDLNGADCIGLSGEDASDRIVIDECLARRAASDTIAAPEAHGDLLQSTNPRNVSITRSTFYLPATASTYDEGVVGSTNCLRFADHTALMSEIYIIGNIIAGASYPVQLNPRYTGSEIRNVVLALNRYGEAPDYAINGAIRLTTSEDNGYWTNIAIFDEYFSDGTTPVPLADTAVPVGYVTGTWGVFSFNKGLMSDKFKMALWTLGQATGREILSGRGNLNPDFDLGNLT